MAAFVLLQLLFLREAVSPGTILVALPVNFLEASVVTVFPTSSRRKNSIKINLEFTILPLWLLPNTRQTGDLGSYQYTYLVSCR